MATIDDVNDVAAAFLVAAVDALALTDAGAPARAYTSASRPALDCCGQVTAWAETLGEADTRTPDGGLGPMMRGKKIGAVLQLTVFIQATRCQPTSKESGGRIVPPSAEDLAAASRQVNQDLWALWNHLNDQVKNGALAKICKGAQRLAATAVPSQGGCVGWEVSYVYEIPGGYPFELAT